MGDGRLGVFMNHELRENQGIPRAHGYRGAFVSKLTVDLATGAVAAGEDLIKKVHYWQYAAAAGQYGDTPQAPAGAGAGHSLELRRFCSGSQAGGDEIARAGLTNGANFVFDAVDETVTNDAQWRATYGKGAPGQVDLAEVGWNQSGVAQNVEGKADGLSLNRIEDGAFDPRSPDDYYFLTTEGGGTAQNPELPGVTRDGGGLWRLRFADVDRPGLGATLELLLDGSEKPYLSKPDNLEIDEHGNLLIQEDPGNNAALARILAYRIADGARGVLAQFDPARFSGAADADFLTLDEESSGILDVSRLVGKKGTFAFDAQVHKAHPDPELVEEGQLLSMTVQAWGQVYTIMG